MNVAQETLGFRRAGLSPALSLLMSAFALLIAPASLSRHLHSLRERSSTTPSNPSIALAQQHIAKHNSQCLFDASLERNRVDCLRSAASVIGLSPVTSSAQDDSISELLRFL